MHMVTYIFSNLETACESRLVMQFYKSNATIAIVARKPILHYVIKNMRWLLIGLSIMK